jgi:hypothetical protein
MDSKKMYAELCKSENLSIFMQDWWLDVVCDVGNWQPVLVFDKNEKPIGATFFYQKKKLGFSIVTQPPMTPITQIWYRPLPADAIHKEEAYKADILKKIIEKIPKSSFFQVNFHFSLKNHLPFHWAGFKQTTRYTYLIDLTSTIDEIHSNLKHNVRTNLKKAEKNINIAECFDLEIVYETLRFSFLQNKIKTPFSFEKLNALYQKLLENKSVFIYLATNENGHIEGVAFIVLDKKTAYFLFSGKKSEKNNATMSLLVWKSIEKAKTLGYQYFDFDGSVLSQIEPFFQSFGGERMSYFQIFKTKNKWLEWLFQLR